jgi:hypothetical protein
MRKEVKRIMLRKVNSGQTQAGSSQRPLTCGV